MKRFIVTGGYGFIGSNLIRILLKKKHKVLNIDNLSYAAQKYNLKNISDKKYIFKKIDINQKEKISKIIRSFKPDGIFNLAADTHVDRSIENSFKFIKNNILGVYNLLEAIKSQAILRNVDLFIIFYFVGYMFIIFIFDILFFRFIGRLFINIVAVFLWSAF